MYTEFKHQERLGLYPGPATGQGDATVPLVASHSMRGTASSECESLRKRVNRRMPRRFFFFGS